MVLDMSDIFDAIATRPPKGIPEYNYLVGGHWRASDTGQWIEVTSPVDNSPLGKVPACSQEEADAIIRNAGESRPLWAEKSLYERAEVLSRAARLLTEHKEELANLLVMEIGKPRKASEEEVLRSADLVDYAAEESKRIQGEVLRGDAFPGYKKNKMALVMYEPVGTILAFPPFNYPINLAVSKIAPALAAGNSVVMKPPSQGAVSGLHLAAVFMAAGLPPGVLNVVTGRGSVLGEYLVQHPQINMFTFTGSTPVWKRLAEKAGMLAMQLELGGKDVALVLPDADLDNAVKNIVSGAYAYSGQRCTAVKRVLAIEPVGDELVARMIPAVQRLTVGDPRGDADLGPLIDDEAAEYVQELIDEALEKGAKLLVGPAKNTSGRYFKPVLLDAVTPEMRVAWEEPFGPVLPIIRVQNHEEAVELANRSEYGLQASVFTQNLDLALSLARRIEAGSVQINAKTSRGPDHFPFMGVKGSGLGVQGVRYSILSMMRTKAVILNLNL